jgi:HD-like signal output (HDOD) protein
VQWTVEKLLLRTPSLSSLPSIYTRLNDTVNDPRAASRDVANVIAEDPGLAARLLRLANSAFYGFPSGIDTISRAVTLVGTHQLRDLALATSVIKQFDGMSVNGLSMETFWRHSIACGVAARILATYQCLPNVERFFVAGLMHDIGRLIMFCVIPELAEEAMDIAERNEDLLHRTERTLLGFDHADVGGALLRQWKLPAHTVSAVAWHHKPDADKSLCAEVAVTHVADIIANAIQIGSSGERFVPGLNDDAWKSLGISENILPAMLPDLERQYHDAVMSILPEHAV